MSERDGREQVTHRSSFRRSLNDPSLPSEYLAQLDEKRKQLDESIHKYIAAKERDFKTFEKELRQHHRVAQGQDGGGRRRASSDAPQHETEALGRTNGTPLSPTIVRSLEATDDNMNATRLDRSAIAGLTDRRASEDRDRDFVGLFTPPYLSAFDDRDSRDLERTSSLPSSVPTIGTHELTASIEHLRANSDSAAQARRKRPSHLALVQRTSSSGSSADGKLTSALKSPSHQQKQPKQKRVSLAVGDAIVAPSDNVPAVATNSNTPSHSRQRSSGSRRGLTTLSRETSQSSIVLDDTFTTGLSVAASTSATDTPTERDTVQTIPDSITPTTISAVSRQPTNRSTTPSARKMDPDGDLFDLEEVENVPIEHNEHEDLESALESEDEDDGLGEEDERESFAAGATSAEHRLEYDSREGLVPEPQDGIGSAVPYLEFKPGSAVASQQPIHPGFRRPSVADDPIYRGKNYDNAERDAVEDDIYGSSFARPASKGSFTAGSLGESYMVAHAADMERSRAARKQNGMKT